MLFTSITCYSQTELLQNKGGFTSAFVKALNDDGATRLYAFELLTEKNIVFSLQFEEAAIVVSPTVGLGYMSKRRMTNNFERIKFGVSYTYLLENHFAGLNGSIHYLTNAQKNAPTSFTFGTNLMRRVSSEKQNGLYSSNRDDVDKTYLTIGFGIVQSFFAKRNFSPHVGLQMSVADGEFYTMLCCGININVIK